MFHDSMVLTKPEQCNLHSAHTVKIRIIHQEIIDESFDITKKKSISNVINASKLSSKLPNKGNNDQEMHYRGLKTPNMLFQSKIYVFSAKKVMICLMIQRGLYANLIYISSHFRGLSANLYSIHKTVFDNFKVLPAEK